MSGAQEKEKRRDPSPPHQEHGLGLAWRVGNWPFLLVIYAYRVTLSPIMGGQCRFEPTCSRYGIEAYKTYGPIRGTMMTGKRILRCNPFSKGGYDPVPIRSCGHEHNGEQTPELHEDAAYERERD